MLQRTYRIGDYVKWMALMFWTRPPAWKVVGGRDSGREGRARVRVEADSVQILEVVVILGGYVEKGSRGCAAGETREQAGRRPR